MAILKLTGTKAEDLKKSLATALGAIETAKTRSEKKTIQEQAEEAVKKAMSDLRSNPGNYVFDNDEDGIAEHVKRFPVTSAIVSKRNAWRKDEAVKAFQDWNDDVYLCSRVLKRSPRSLSIYQNRQKEMSELGKALNTATSTEGSEWIPTEFSAQLIDLMALELKVAGIFPEIQMPSPQFSIPQLTGRSTTKLVNESTSDAPAAYVASQLTTGKTTLDAVKFATRTNLSEEMNEDSIVAMRDIIRNDIAMSQAEAVENTLINGDTTGTHQDSDVVSSEDVRKAWIGLRKMSLVANAKLDIEASSGTLGFVDYQAIRKAMGKYGVSPSGIVWIMSIASYFNTINALADQVVTLDKYGPSAFVMNGELGKLMGSPMIVSEYVREDLNASAVYDGTTTTKTIILCVRKDAGIIGRRRGLTIKTGELIESGQEIMVATQRLDFKSRYPSSQKTVGTMYNITS